MQYSPKLKNVMLEIRKILQANNIAGVIALHNIEGKPQVDGDGFTHVQGFVEYMQFLTPSYSALEVNGNKVNIKNKISHYSSKEERDEFIANTANMVETLGIVTGQVSLHCMDLYEKIKTVNETKDTGPGTHSSNTEQNN